jgi:DnaJ-class molecular chaperone
MAEMGDDWFQDEPRERVDCPKCGASGLIDDSTECEHCDGLGYEWWLP